MTRSEAIKAFFFKSVLPVTVALILYCIFKSACVKNGELDYVWLWILCGLPFGLHRMCLWIVPGGGSLGGGIALSDVMGIIGGAVVGVLTLGIPWQEYWKYTYNALTLNNFWLGIFHGFVYGWIISLCGCYYGIYSGRNADSVGVATTNAVVSSIVWMIVVTGFLTVFFQEVNI